ncbi:MAG: hypothetical protein QGG40_20730 [Myxococcota bacterium]|nr:hypothetical protein [Myxococcota bacterium]
MSLVGALLLGFTVACVPVPDEDTAVPYTGCNGSEVLCGRALDEVAFLRTHNSHATEERDYHPVAMNHYFAIPTQLADGARAINVDVYEVEGELLACHSYCELGSQPFVQILDEIATFLDARGREVILLNMQDEAPLGEVRAAIEGHALASWAHTQIPGQAWPTLEALVDADTRLVVLADPDEGAPAWYHDESALVYATTWYYTDPGELDCVTTTDPFPHGLYEVTHVLTAPIALPELAEQINAQPFIGERLARCQQELGHIVNIVNVDYYSIGDTVGAVADLNAP